LTQQFPELPDIPEDLSQVLPEGGALGGSEGGLVWQRGHGTHEGIDSAGVAKETTEAARGATIMLGYSCTDSDGVA
jgi:hypothetical protein